MSKVSEKTKANAIRQARQLYQECVSMAGTLKANGLDDRPADKAAKALYPLVAELEAAEDARRQAKEAYHLSVGGVGGSEVERLRSEVATLKKQLAGA